MIKHDHKTVVCLNVNSLFDSISSFDIECTDLLNQGYKILSTHFSRGTLVTTFDKETYESNKEESVGEILERNNLIDSLGL